MSDVAFVSMFFRYLIIVFFGTDVEILILENPRINMSRITITNYVAPI